MLENPFDIKEYPYCHSGHTYAEDVLSGEIVACKYVIGACRRYMEDLEVWLEQEDFAPYFFDLDKAEHFLRIVQKFHHVIGDWETATIVYEPWQNFCFMNIMGWYSLETGYRKYRVAHVEISRGNGKSCIASQAALYFLSCAEGMGNKVACVATKKEQARIVLDSSREMAKKNSSFLRKKNVEVLAHKIVKDDTFAEIRALSSDQNGLDGLNDVLAICDELHAMKKEVFEVISSGMSKRRDSLLLCITTAGFNVESVGHSQSAYAKKVATGEVDDEQFFSLVYTLDDNDDFTDERVWIKANPNYGKSVDPTTLRAKVKKASVSPSDVANLKVKHFNIWLSEAQAFYSQQKWDACLDEEMRIEDFKNEKCFLGLDLSSKIDLTCAFKIFRRKLNDEWHYYLFDDSYIPEETLKESKNTLFEECAAEGHLHVTKGEAIHYPQIEEQVIKDAKEFSLIAAHYDPWNATQMAQNLKNSHRVNMVEFRMNTANLSEPTKTLDALIRQKRIHHNGSPLLRWCLGNVVCKEDAAGNVFPRKSHDRLKIDPIISALMALAGWIQEEENESVYEQRGIRVL